MWLRLGLWLWWFCLVEYKKGGERQGEDDGDAVNLWLVRWIGTWCGVVWCVRPRVEKKMQLGLASFLYSSSTVPPAASMAVLSFSASSLLRPSLRT